MEFNEKLQELRKQKGLTQEELAGHLFVSRAAISKWESGRGYPGIDSLKSISKFFSVSIDDLLSGDELIILAEEEQKEKLADIRQIIFDLLDACAALLLILPLFAERSGTEIRSVSLLFLNSAPYVRILCFLSVLLTAARGILSLVFQKRTSPAFFRCRERISLGLSCFSILILIITLHPYAAIYTFILLLTKGILLLKRT